MSSIDERVVSMKFDNAQFEQGVKTTLASLDALKKGMKLEGATKGLNDLGNTAKNVQIGHIASAVDDIAGRFKAMSIVAITALTTIAHQALVTGGQFVKSLTVEPILSGLHEYETNLNSIQTILANTGLEGQAGLNKVINALDILNHYSDQTIYNFSEMARNIGTFTAAGVKLDVAVDAIKGIANLAAISGSNAQQASTAMYQLSQALAAGTVKLMDWNSVVNAGMGGKVFQDALMETARIHGVAIDKMIKNAGSFRATLEKGWLTSEILTETLQKFTGDLTAAQLKTMGYNDQQIEGILKLGRTAQDAATKVKTMSQLINTLQEAAGSGWAKTWQLIFGDFEEARTLFTNVNNVLGGFISKSADMRNKVIEDWKKLGGRASIIQSIANVFNALISVIKPIRDAFREIFPRATGKQLFEITLAIQRFTENLKIGVTTSENLRRTFAGVFAILGIGWDIVKEGIKLFFRLFGVAADGSSGFLESTASIGDFFVALRKAIKEGNGIVIFFDRLGNALEVPIRLLSKLGDLIGHIFDDFDAAGAAKAVTGFVAKFEPLTRMGDLVADAWGTVFRVLSDVFDTFGPVIDHIVGFFSRLGPLLTGAFAGIDYQDVLSTLNTGLFAGLVVLFGKFFHNITQGDGLLEGVKRAFGGLTDTMQTMQNTLRAVTLLQIAAAIAVLTVSVVALSKIDSEGLTRALVALSVMFAQLLTSMLLFEKISGFSGLAKMPLVTAAMILLGIAIDILASAVKKLSDLDWSGLARGLTGVTVLIGGLVAAIRFIPPSPGIIASATALVILSGAVKILASAVTDLTGLSWSELTKGLVGVGAVLAALALFTKFAAADKGGVLQGAGIILLAVGIKILASAMEDFSKFSWEEIGKGLAILAGSLALIGTALALIPPSSVISAAGILITATSLGLIADALKKMGDMSWSEIGKGLVALAGALTLIGLAISLIPPTAPLSAAGVLIVAAALGMIGEALKKFGGMSWGEIAKSLVTLAGALLIIGVAITAMTGALPGAAALLVVAGALAILTPILLTLGQMDWGEIVKGLATLAGVFLVLGVAGAVLTPVVPTLIGLGAAITLLGTGVALAGVGLLAFSAGLTALSISGAAGAAALVAIVKTMTGMIPMVMEQIALGLVAFGKIISTAGETIFQVLTTILIALLEAIEAVIPKLVTVLIKLVTILLETLVKYTPKFTDSGLKILTGFLQGVANNIDRVVTAATNIIVNFINSLAKNQPRIIQAGVDFIISFINGLTKAINDNSERMGKAGGDLATAIIKGMVKGLLAGGGQVAKAAKDVAKAALNAAKDFLGIHSPSKVFEEEVGRQIPEGAAIGVTKYGHLVSDATEKVGDDAVATMKRRLSDLSKVVTDDIDMTPTIRPVLDLTDIQQGVRQLPDIIGRKPLMLDTSITGASNAAVAVQENQDLVATLDEDRLRPDVTFNQYNNSPKALSSAEIYRQTSNQLSKVKEALPV